MTDIKCPYCGYDRLSIEDILDMDNLFDGEELETLCDECGNWFMVESHVVVTVSVYKLDTVEE